MAKRTMASSRSTSAGSRFSCSALLRASSARCCAFSAAAKWDFRKRKVDYLEVDVAQEPDKIPDLLALTNGERLTPVIVENGTVTIGFKGGS